MPTQYGTSAGVPQYDARAAELKPHKAAAPRPNEKISRKVII